MKQNVSDVIEAYYEYMHAWMRYMPNMPGLSDGMNPVFRYCQ